MRDDTSRQGVLFEGLAKRPVIVSFDQAQASSDGGAVLLKACDTRLRLSERLADCIVDERQGGKVRHSMCELTRQRLFAIACGYADANDAARLGDDPVHKMLLDRDPVVGETLASQPTLCRFENGMSNRTLMRMCTALAETVIERHRRRRGKSVRRITVDLDPTDDPTRGQQELAFFNGHYDTWCYLPVAGFLTFDDEVEQYLFACVLRPGNAPAALGAIGILRRLFARLRAAFPKARIRVRLDGGFAGAGMFAFLEAEGVEYLVAMAKNAVLKRYSEALMQPVRERSDASGRTEHAYSESRYQADGWPQSRRVIFKAEVVRHPGRLPKDNPRFVVTNLTATPRHIYERIYRMRGDVENRLKELHHGLEIDRTSCKLFRANQFRVLLTAAAYVLFQELRLHARRTGCARAQVSTLRERLLKLGARIDASVRRIVIHLPRSTPFADDWRRIARSIGAVPA